MISLELIRRYPFFGGLSHQQIVTLAKTASEINVEAGHYFFHEDDHLDSFYLVLEGAVAVLMEVPHPEARHTIADQLTRQLQTEEVVISAIGPGEVFGWSALVAPYQTTAGAKATTPCRVIAFDCHALRQAFDEDCQFGYLMMQKAAQLIRGRLQDKRIESLAHLVA